MEITSSAPANLHQLTRPVAAEQSQRYIDQVWTIIHRLEDSHPAFKGVVQQIKMDESRLGPGASPAKAIFDGKRTLVVRSIIPELYTLLEQSGLTVEQREEAERTWTRYVPSRTTKNEELSYADIDGRSMALLTFLFHERYSKSAFHHMSPEQIVEQMCSNGTTPDELLTRVRASFLTQYLSPNTCSLDSMFIHEMEHLRQGDDDLQVDHRPAFFAAHPDLLARYPCGAKDQSPTVSKAFLALPLVTLVASVFSDISLAASLALGGLSLYLAGSYLSVRRTIRENCLIEGRKAFRDWREARADLAIINHGSSEEIACGRDFFAHCKTELTLDYLFTNCMIALVQGSPWRRLLRVVASGNRFVQDLIYRMVAGYPPLPSEIPGRSFKENYAANWGREMHIEGWKRLNIWDENVAKKKFNHD